MDANEIYEKNRPKHHDWGTLKSMCLASMEEYAKAQAVGFLIDVNYQGGKPSDKMIKYYEQLYDQYQAQEE